MIFGTGAHASTQMCMQALEQAVHGGERVIDLGSGSGILSITARCCWGQPAPPASISTRRRRTLPEANAAMNGLTGEKFQAVTADVLADRGQMDALSAGGMRSSWPISWRMSLSRSRPSSRSFASGRAVPLLRHPGPAAGGSAGGHGAAGLRSCRSGRWKTGARSQRAKCERTCADLPPARLVCRAGDFDGSSLP